MINTKNHIKRYKDFNEFEKAKFNEIDSVLLFLGKEQKIKVLRLLLAKYRID